METELKIFELLDLFMRDSFLGVYQSRLSFIQTLTKYFESKTPKFWQRDRLQKVLNILYFVYNYYNQFQQKLKSTVERLDADAREKVKTLVNVKKWTVQKFSIVKNNIDKTHKQLNRACKQEEEALIQNVQALVLESTRKKFVKDDELRSLDSEFPKILEQTIPKMVKSNE